MSERSYEIDLAMCGGEFRGRVEDVAAYLTAHGWPTRAIDTYNGARNEKDSPEPPDELWLDALMYAEDDLLVGRDISLNEKNPHAVELGRRGGQAAAAARRERDR